MKKLSSTMLRNQHTKMTLMLSMKSPLMNTQLMIIMMLMMDTNLLVATAPIAARAARAARATAQRAARATAQRAVLVTALIAVLAIAHRVATAALALRAHTAA